MTSTEHDDQGIELRLASSCDAPVIHALVQEAFSARPALDPPAAALSDTVADIRVRLAKQTGLLATLAGDLVGCLFLEGANPAEPGNGGAMVHRVAVHPGHRKRGIATLLVRAAAELAIRAGRARLSLIARKELPGAVHWWQNNGFAIVADIDQHSWLMAIDLPSRFLIPTAEDMVRLGTRLAGLLRSGDVIVASGDLGAGKTTLTQGIGAGLGVSQAITSPTFVLSRIHPTKAGPSLVHVDAYRLGSAAELDDIDLDLSLSESITLIEWGEGLAEQLSADRLEILIRRSADPTDDTRMVDLLGVGRRWAGLRDEVSGWDYQEALR